MLNVKTMLLAAAATVSLSACTTDQYGNQHASRALKGAGIGAAGGAIIGAIAGDPLAGAAIGAAGGAIIGAIEDDKNRYRDYNGQRYYYEPDGRSYYYDRDRRRHYVRPR